MTSVDLESGRRDPILRLDQFIARQDLMIKLLKLQVQLLQVVAILQGVILFVGVAFLIYAIWK